MQDYTNGGSGGGKKSPIVIILIVLAVMAFFGLACCGVGTWMGLSGIQNIEKTYYPECENAADPLSCENCCRDKGHNGHLYGEFLNEDGKVCGCFGE